MAKRIKRAIELPEADQAIYYDGPHTNHVLTCEQGCQAADALRHPSERQLLE